MSVAGLDGIPSHCSGARYSGVPAEGTWRPRDKTQVEVKRVDYEGASSARPAPGVLDAIAAADAIIICPSNPVTSIGPILAVPGIAGALGATEATVLAVSPIVGGKAVKGPLGSMIPELTGQPPTAAAIAQHYGSLLAGIVVERGDEEGFGASGIAVLACDTVMRSREDSLRLAREVLAFAGSV